MFNYNELEKYSEKSLNYHGFIYLIVNKVNNKFYIGKFQNYRYTNGIRKNIRDYSDYYGSGKLISKAVEKYGKENFDRYILEYTFNHEDARKKELYYQNKYNVDKNENFYNISINSDGGNTISGYTEEQMVEYKNNMSKKIKEAYINNPKMRENVSNGVKKAFQRQEYKEKQSIAQTKRFANQEERDKISKAGKDFWNSERGKQIKEKRRAKCMPYYMLDDNFEIIRKFNNCEEVLDFLGLKGHMTLNKSIKNKTKYKGYYWKKG